MPIQKSDEKKPARKKSARKKSARKKATRAAPPAPPQPEREKRFHVRLKRFGQQGEQGLGRYYLGHKLYKRGGIYTVDLKTYRKLQRTGKFEAILPEDLVQARKDSDAGRGVTLQQRTRIRRRDAARRRRPQVEREDDEDDRDGVDSGAGYELTADEDVDGEFADDADDDEDAAVV